MSLQSIEITGFCHSKIIKHTYKKNNSVEKQWIIFVACCFEGVVWEGGCRGCKRTPLFICRKTRQKRWKSCQSVYLAVYWPRVARLAFFKLFGLKKFCCLLAFFGLISSWLASTILFGLLALFWPLLSWNRCLWRKYYYSICVWNTFAKCLW